MQLPTEGITYEEYERRCKAEGIAPVAPETNGILDWEKFCIDNHISNAIVDVDGVEWAAKARCRDYAKLAKRLEVAHQQGRAK